ncbi:hypothetical protein RCL1_001491 [Eukaryota sp. TZLM3-RCL]
MSNSLNTYRHVCRYFNQEGFKDCLDLFMSSFQDKYINTVTTLLVESKYLDVLTLLERSFSISSDHLFLTLKCSVLVRAITEYLFSGNQLQALSLFKDYLSVIEGFGFESDHRKEFLQLSQAFVSSDVSVFGIFDNTSLESSRFSFIESVKFSLNLLFEKENSLVTSTHVKTSLEDIIENHQSSSITTSFPFNSTSTNLCVSSKQLSKDESKDESKESANPEAIRQDERVKRIVELLPDGVPISSYLDVGCGNGEITQSVGNFFGIDRANGVDVREASNEFINYQKIDGENLPFEDNSFDLVTCFVAIHHFRTDKMLKEMARVLKLGGLLVIREHDVVETRSIPYLQFIHFLYDTRRELYDVMDQEYYGFCSFSSLLPSITSLGFDVFIVKRYPPPNNALLYHACFVKSRESLSHFVPLQRSYFPDYCLEKRTLYKWVIDATEKEQKLVTDLLQFIGFPVTYDDALKQCSVSTCDADFSRWLFQSRGEIPKQKFLNQL